MSEMAEKDGTSDWLDRYVLAMQRRLQADGHGLVELRTAEDVRRFFQRKGKSDG